MSERKGTKGLELWCKRLVRDCPEVQIDNMTTSWRNGIAFCALVHHFRPDLIDMTKLKPENIYENNQLAFSIAEKHLGIPSLLDPEDMVENDVPDRLSILTYLSQFYQRLSHTVNTKVSENEPKITSPTTKSAESVTPIRFGKTGLDKCTACGLPVYLAQRLIVSHKLYHRRCFRCSKCSGQLNPKSFEIIEGCDFSCDSCKNEKSLSKYLNNNDCEQIGMLAFNDDLNCESKDISQEEPIKTKQKSRPQSILDKINMFENKDKEASIDSKIANLSIKDNLNPINKESSSSGILSDTDAKNLMFPSNTEYETSFKNVPEKVYKSNIDKFNFLQTQLSDNISGETLDDKPNIDDMEVSKFKHKDEDCLTITNNSVQVETNLVSDKCITTLKEDSNITDDSRIAKSHSISSNLDNPSLEQLNQNEQEVKITVPPRRKKQIASEKVLPLTDKKQSNKNMDNNEYPDHLNPFSDDDGETEDMPKESIKKVSTNPFGSSDDEDDDVPPMHPPPKVPTNDIPPIKRLIAVNPFWSDGEEPSSDEEMDDRSSKMYKSSMATSTPNLPSSTPRRRKPKAPPPPVITLTHHSHSEHPSTSMDDLASISSLSSFNSTVHSDHKDRSTPIMKKKRPAPTPPDSLSTVSGHGGSMEKGLDASGLRSANSSLAGKRTKGPAPGLPLPERREVKLQMSPEDLQVQLDLLETQQLGLERQGVLIEKMIRDKCEGDDATPVPQEEVEDLVIQLCELVNEKNDLFRKQTELMYIRRQQRLEQEQADIEHEIRIIQSRPAVNRIDSDKVREEQLVSRLVEIVRMRDELVQQIEAERRRERQEDLAIAASIASKRAQRNSESNSSSMKSVEVPTPKKNKVKDKVKKQLKKAKHTLIMKKKDDSADHKEEKPEKEKKSK